MAIIDENDIWVVGDIRMKDTHQQDSLGNTIQPYNAAHWDGQEWELVRINKIRDGQRVPILPVRGILPIDNHHFWIAAGSIYYWDQNIATLSYQRNINTHELITNLWGNSTVYGAGSAGILVAYDGNTWQEIDTHTDINLTDIWGQVNQTDSLVIYATVAKETFHPDDPDSKILKITGTEVREVSSEGLPRHLSGIWFDEKAGYFVVGTRIFYTRTLDENSQWTVIEPDITSSYLRDIVAADTNDIFIVGDFGTVIHYNGSTWKNLSDTQLPAIQAVLKTLEIVGDLVVITGTLTSSAPPRGIILTGKRIKN